MNNNTVKHHVIILPGLSDEIKEIQLVPGWWRLFGLTPHMFRVGWRDESSEFLPKLDQIVGLIDQLGETGKVSLVGTSAGGSAAFNAFLLRTDKVHKALSICSRLRTGDHKFRSIERMTKTSELFRKSVELFESQEADIPESLKSRIMTITALFGDELVPRDTSSLDGARNIVVPTGEHIFSIGMSLTLFGYIVIKFLNSPA